MINNIITIAATDSIEDAANEILENTNLNVLKPDMIKKYLDALPEKAIAFGVRLLAALLIFLIGVQMIKLLRKLIKKTMERAHADNGAVRFMDSFSKAALYVVLVFLIANFCGVDAAGIIALLGSAGVAIGLAVQGSLSNLAGGVLLLILHPFRVGDYITTDSGHEGTVDEIQIFYTKLKTPDNKVIVLPNGQLSNNSLVNATASKHRRVDIFVGISYQADIRKAKDILLHLLQEDNAVCQERDKQVYVDELGDSSIKIGIRCWFHREDYLEGKWRLTENIKYALDAAQIDIPYPQIDVHITK
jgi:small conductance mechanosensitive channel